MTSVRTIAAEQKKLQPKTFGNLYVSIATNPDELDIKLPDEKYIDQPSIKLCFNYPLSCDVIFEFTAPNNQFFTRKDISKIVCETYQKIYDEEEKSTQIPVGNIPNMLNRNKTDGTYGIWGHDIEDLQLNYIYRKSDGIYYMSIDS